MLSILNNNDVKILQQGSIDIMVESYSNATRTLQIRGMTKEQAISADITTSSDRSLVTTIIDVTDAPISLTARTSGRGVKRGELFVKISLRVDGVVVALLAEGYVAESHKIAWPGGDFEGSTDGRGLIRSVSGTDPAAGSEILETVPVGACWRLISANATIVTDATVIGRRPALIIDDGINAIYKISDGADITAGLTAPVVFSQGFGAAVVSNGIHVIAFPQYILLQAGYRIKTVTSNLQAGDNYSAPQLLVEEWIQP